MAPSAACNKVIGVKLDDGRVVKDEYVETSAYARNLAVDVEHPETGEVLAQGGDDIGDVLINQLVEAGIARGQGPLGPDL